MTDLTIEQFAKEIKNEQAENRPKLIRDMFTRSVEQLAQELMDEIEAKNLAHNFILEKGYMNEFYEYRKKQKNIDSKIV